jgi:hypothetical protein
LVAKPRLGDWKLVSNHPRHEGQAKEFLDFLTCLYGREYAEEIAAKAVASAREAGDKRVDVDRVHEAAEIRLPPYVAEFRDHYRKHGKEALASGHAQMARRVKPWFDKYARPRSR